MCDYKRTHVLLLGYWKRKCQIIKRLDRLKKLVKYNYVYCLSFMHRPLVAYAKLVTNTASYMPFVQRLPY